MGFNFFSALGGAADQITRDLDEQEKEVKLRTRTILDKQIAETAANRKEYKANKKRVTEQLNALVPLFGDDKNALAKARSIVAGGDTHFNNVFGLLQKHKINGGDANTIVKFAPDANITGFKNVEDATNSLVQMASIPAPTFATKPDETTSAFGLDLGTSMYRGYYDKARAQYVKAGLLDATKPADDTVASYTAAEIDLSGFKKDQQTLDQQKSALVSQLRALKDKTGPEAQAIQKEIDFVDKYRTSGSVALEVARINAKQKGGLTVSQHQDVVAKGVAIIENKYKLPITQAAVGVNNVAKAREKEINQLKTDYVKTQILNGMPNNAKAYIDADPSLTKIYDKILNEADEIQKKNEAFKGHVDTAKSAGSPEAYIQSLPEGQRNPEALKPILQQAFPDSDIDSILSKLK